MQYMVDKGLLVVVSPINHMEKDMDGRCIGLFFDILCLRRQCDMLDAQKYTYSMARLRPVSVLEHHLRHEITKRLHF